MTDAEHALDSAEYEDFRQKRQRTPVAEDVAELLRSHIKNASLIDGDALPSEASLSKSLGVSQRAVRDALRMLAQQGVLVTHQGKRATVRTPEPLPVMYYFQRGIDASEDGVFHLMELRVALESTAAALAAVRATRSDLDEIRAICDERLLCGDDDQLRVELDAAFHRRIAAASGNTFIYDIIVALRGALEDQLRRGITIAGGQNPRDRKSDELHTALVEALEARDAKGAAGIATAIIESARGFFTGRETGLPVDSPTEATAGSGTDPK